MVFKMFVITFCLILIRSNESTYYISHRASARRRAISVNALFFVSLLAGWVVLLG